VATTEKLLALDTPSLYFRAFFGVPDTVTAPDGTPVNAVRGLIDFIARLISVTKATRLVAAMDADWRPAWRVAAIPAYKEHRVGDGGGDQSPDALNVQVPIIEAVLDAVGLCRIGVANFEADDVIGTLAATAGCAVDIVTGDRDLFQLVRDEVPVRVLYTARGVGRADTVDEAWVANKYGIPGRGYAEFATLRGDPSDGLPGVPGVGDKTAAALITKFATMSDVLAAAAGDTDDGFPAGSRKKVLAARDYLERAHGVVQVVCDVTLPDHDDRIPAEPRHPEELIELSQRWGLDSPLNRLLDAMRQSATRQATTE
jgi:5'-3' exonuclease